jgi:hypothetical protein
MTDDDETRMHLNFLPSFMDRDLDDDRKKTVRLIEAGHISFYLL